MSSRERPQGSARGLAPSKPARRKGAGPCPICGKKRSEEFRPFCSKHCADIDLGRWLEGRYAVPGAPAAKDESGKDEE